MIKWLWHYGNKRPSRGAILSFFNRRERQQKDNEPHFPYLVCPPPMKSPPLRVTVKSPLQLLHERRRPYWKPHQRVEAVQHIASIIVSSSWQVSDDLKTRLWFIRCQRRTSKQHVRKAVWPGRVPEIGHACGLLSHSKTYKHIHTIDVCP